MAIMAITIIIMAMAIIKMTETKCEKKSTVHAKNYDPAFRFEFTVFAKEFLFIF